MKLWGFVLIPFLILPPANCSLKSNISIGSIQDFVLLLLEQELVTLEAQHAQKCRRSCELGCADAGHLPRCFGTNCPARRGLLLHHLSETFGTTERVCAEHSAVNTPLIFLKCELFLPGFMHDTYRLTNTDLN